MVVIIMRKKYNILWIIIAIEFVVISFISKSGFKSRTWIGNAIGVLIFILPIQLLLFKISTDESVSNKRQKLSKGLFWFVWVCYLLGGIATLIEFIGLN